MQQSGITADLDDTQLALLKGNLAYKKNMGFIFLQSKLAGLSSEDVLQDPELSFANRFQRLRERIVHDQLANCRPLLLAQELMHD